MAPDPTSSPDTPSRGLRIGHAERDRTMALLREHTAAGRLDLDEFEERAGLVAAARTSADLDDVLTDLPHLSRHDTSPSDQPVAIGGGSAVAPRWDAHPRPHRGPGRAVPGWIVISLLLVAIWAMAGFGTFWPMWVIVPLAFGAFGSCHHSQSERRSDHHLSA